MYTGESVSNHIKILVDALPERYQPIFGFPDITLMTSRDCHDRLYQIEAIASSLRRYLGRPLRVLDLGCAQGFFSFSLASAGDSVIGVDFLDKNISLCHELASLNPELDISFRHSRVEKIITSMEPGQFDLVLGLSVFHHLIHEHGIEAVQSLFRSLADKVLVGIYELAMKSEPLYWAVSLPENPREVIASYAFITEVAQFPTHLSNVFRPMYFASNKHIYADQSLRSFSYFKVTSHFYERNAHMGTRRYYFSDDILVKQYLPDERRDFFNRKEYENEVNFLLAPPAGFTAPEIIFHREQAGEVLLMRGLLRGKLISDCIQSGASYDDFKVVGDILKQLILLEKNGLFHGDVRTWNVLLGDDGRASLIDYGAISTEKYDCVWPRNIYLSFILFIQEVCSRECSDPSPIRSPFVLSNIPSIYQDGLAHFLGSPSSQWSFELMWQCLQKGFEGNGDSFGDVLFLEIAEMNRIYKDHAQDLKRRISELEKEKENLTERWNGLEASYQMLINSRSWRLTKPLRSILGFIKGFYRQD